jgi:monoamine oxidase
MFRNVLIYINEISPLFPVRYTSRRSSNMTTKPHVGVIGAGLSGLRCADILVQNGARVTILEARNRVGGRVCLSPSLEGLKAFHDGSDLRAYLSY